MTKLQTCSLISCQCFFVQAKQSFVAIRRVVFHEIHLSILGPSGTVLSAFLRSAAKLMLKLEIQVVRQGIHLPQYGPEVDLTFKRAFIDVLKWKTKKNNVQEYTNNNPELRIDFALKIPLINPTDPFTIFRAIKPAYQRTLCSSETTCDGFWSYKIVQRSVGYFSVDSGYFSLTEHFTIHSDESQFRIVTQLPKFGTLELNESLVGLLGENYLQNLTHPLKVCGAGRGNRRSGQVLFFTVVVVVTGTSPVFASLVSVVVKISFPLVGVWHRRQETETTLFGRARGGTQGASLKKRPG